MIPFVRIENFRAKKGGISVRKCIGRAGEGLCPENSPSCGSVLVIGGVGATADSKIRFVVDLLDARIVWKLKNGLYRGGRSRAGKGVLDRNGVARDARSGDGTILHIAVEVLELPVIQNLAK